MLDFLLSLIFPKRCVGCRKIGTYVCSNCFANISLYQEFVCPMCLRRSIDGKTHPSCITPHSLDGLMAGVVYKGVVKRLVFRFKYPPYIANLQELMGKIFTEMIAQNELFMHTLPQQPIVIPIPLSSQKLKKRGYNQAELLSKRLANDFNLKHMNELLKRKIHTKPQFQLNKLQRAKNVHGAFEVASSSKQKIKGATILLIDDLATSCATLKECAKVLERAGAKRVYGVTFAREL